jgi:hypothetical protein
MELLRDKNRGIMKLWHIITSIAVMALAVTAFALIDMDNVIAKNTNRPKYDSIEPTVFKDLPEYPANFTVIKRDIFAGQITDLSNISENIYKQPELYPTWEANGQKWFTNHDYSRWGVHGYGLFPGELSYTVSNMTSGDTVNVYSFLHTSWGIETWQGLKLIPEYNNNIFDVSLTPDEVLLEPTFPKFYSNWSQKINMLITAKRPVPQGDYQFSISFTTPSSINSNLWTWQALDKYTNNKYHAEIQKCIDSKLESEQCKNLIELRQNKYVSGDTFAPSKQFTVEIKVT